MADSYTLAEMIDKVRRRADLVNSPFVTDTDVADFLNKGWGKLYDLLVTKYEDFFLASTPIVTVAGQENYDLSAVTPRVFKLRGVDWNLSTAADDIVALERWEWSKRGRFSGLPTIAAGRVGLEMRYLFQGQIVKIKPAPAGGQSLTVWYVPALTKLDDTHGIPDTVQEGWEELAVLEAALICATKEQGMAENIPALVKLRDDVLNDIEGAAMNRDAEQPMRLQKRARYGEDESW